MKRLSHQIYQAIIEMDVLDLALRFTLILLVLSDWVVGPDWIFKVPLRVVAIIGLLVPPLHRNQVLWLIIVAAMWLKTLQNWWTQDNHVFLLTYWCLAVWLSLESREPKKTLAINGRILIGLSFAFATLWKGFLSDDFMDGTYFYYTFLTDSRFQDLGVIIGGMTDEFVPKNVEALIQLDDLRSQLEAVKLESSSRLLGFAKIVTWWTVLIEGAIAITFLWPAGRKISSYRHATLLLFAASTYLVATVETFGWVLLIAGLAQCDPDQPRIRFLYVATALLVLVFDYVVPLSLLRLLVL